VSEPVDLARIVEHVAEIGQMLAKDQPVRVTVEHAPLVVQGNAGRLEQVLLNLINNAIAYAPGKKSIDLSAAAIGDVAEVRVRDYGPGVPIESRAAIFERFTRADQPHGSTGSGLGLGLFIVREIVHAHGGEVSVESTLGEGATFIVRLPLIGRSASAEGVGR
jgi:signal transduction histidine kinase